MNTSRWLNDAARQFLSQDYLLTGQTPEQRIKLIGVTAERILKKPGYAERFEDAFNRGWFSLSSPIWSNFGTDRALPISCYGCDISDKMPSILRTWAEVGMQTKYGGGTSAYFSKLRGRGQAIKDNGESSGSVHFAGMFEYLIKTVSQGSTRRGNFAGWWDVDHPDIMEVLKMRSDGSKIQDLSYGVCVSDRWMREMIYDVGNRRDVWAKVIEARINTGYPYILWTDNANRNKPQVYKDNGLTITHSNLCSEIMLPDGPTESFVCDLASMNILYYDEWKDTDAVEIVAYLLDAVMTEFIEKARNIEFMERAVRFAERHRAIGIGWLGWHSYLQSKMIPFESTAAMRLNAEVASTIKKQAYAASEKLAIEYGEPELLKGYGRRNTTLTAIAPTKSSSFILGQASEGIEACRTNYTVKNLAKGKFTIRNPHLKQLLGDKGCDTPEMWSSILKNAGSVQHLDCLDDHEKAVFRTFSEISPMSMVNQAAQRQQWIDQGQSLNLKIPTDIPAKDINKLMIHAWESGVLSFYYQYNDNAAQSLMRDILSCPTCEA